MKVRGDWWKVSVWTVVHKVNYMQWIIKQRSREWYGIRLEMVEVINSIWNGDYGIDIQIGYGMVLVRAVQVVRASSTTS